MTVAGPVDLALDEAQRGDEEEGPFVIVDVGLLQGLRIFCLSYTLRR